MAQMLQLNRVPEDPEEGDGKVEENDGKQHGGVGGAGAMAQMLQFLIGDRRRRDQELAVERRLREEELRLAKEKQIRVRDKVRDRVRDRVRDKVRDRVRDKVRDRVRDKVRDRVRVRDKVRDRDQNDGLVERFNRTLRKMLGSFAAAYLDDVSIFSETWEEHLQYMAAVL